MKRCVQGLVLASLALLGALGLPTCIEGPPPQAAPTYTYRVVNAYPHDPEAFTQGLTFEDGFLYEGTGRYGHSSLRKVALATGEVLQIHELADTFFGEGITIYGDTIIQLTWRANTGFVYDKATLEVLRQFLYPAEGWGLTTDGQHLIISDGTATLRFLDPETFQETDRLQVRDRGRPVTRLNELEYVQGEVYANVWKTDRIARIDPTTGRVTGWVDLDGLLDGSAKPDVLNGIAYDAANDRLFVTGKLWPKLFEIELVEAE